MHEKTIKGAAGKGSVATLILWLLAMPGSFVILLWIASVLERITGH